MRLIMINRLTTLLAINCIQNKSLCSHSMCVYCVYVLCVYKYTDIHVYIKKKKYLYSVVNGTNISVFGTDTSENPWFSVPISVPKQNTKTCQLKKHTIFIHKVKIKNQCHPNVYLQLCYKFFHK